MSASRHYEQWPRPPRSGCAADTVRARYTEGAIGTRVVPSYVDEPGVDPSRNTETYAALTLHVNSPRWADVPFTLRSGKALATDSAEVAIHFRPIPGFLPRSGPVSNPTPYALGRTQPYVSLSTALNGPGRTAETRPPRDAVDAAAVQRLREPGPSSAPRRDPMLFIRGDEAEESWRIVDPVMQAWAAGPGPDAGIRGRAGATGARNLTITSQAHKSGPGAATSR